MRAIVITALLAALALAAACGQKGPLMMPEEAAEPAPAHAHPQQAGPRPEQNPQ